MRWVPAAAVRPNRCAFLPHLGSHHPEGFFDFGTEIMAFDGHAYVSVVAVRLMAEAMGWAPVLKEDRSRFEDAQREIAALKEQLAEADKFAEAAEYTLGRFGAKVQRKPGRPKKELETA